MTAALLAGGVAAQEYEAVADWLELPEGRETPTATSP